MTMTRLSMILLAAVVATAPACKVRKRKPGEKSAAQERREKREKRREERRAKRNKTLTPEELGPGFAAAKKKLLADPRSCFLLDAALCIDDDDLFAEVFTRTLKRPPMKKRYGTKVPTDGAELTKFVKASQSGYRLASLKTEARRDAIEKHMKARYEKPIVSVDGDTVSADHGHLPGAIERHRANMWRLKNSDLGPKGHWQGSEIGRFLRQLSEKHPDAKTLKLVARVPHHSTMRQVTVSYAKAADRVRLQRRSDLRDYHLSKKLGGDFGKVERGEIAVHPFKMHRCSWKSRDEAGGGCTPPLD